MATTTLEPAPGAAGATAIVPADAFSSAPPAPARRPRVLLIASALAAGASALAIMAMLALHLANRAALVAAGEPTLPEGVTIPLGPGVMNMITFAMSAVTAAWVVQALASHDRLHAYLGVGLTVLLGVATIVQTLFLYTQMGLVIADSAQGVLIYAITGAHMAMTVGGLTFLAVMGFQALGGQLTGRDAEGMAAAALYWYATVAVYAVIWYAIYIIK